MGSETLGDLREQEREARRELILQAARRLFGDRDFREVTVREIARAAGMSPGTIYRYYQNLDDLFLDVFLDGAREITARVEAAAARGSCSLEDFCRVYVGYLNENMSFYQMMGHFMLGGKPDPASTGKVDAVMRDLMDRVERIVTDAGLQGATRIVSHALFSALNGVMISYARYPGRSLEEIREHTLRLAGVIAGLFERSSGVSVVCSEGIR